MTETEPRAAAPATARRSAQEALELALQAADRLGVGPDEMLPDADLDWYAAAILDSLAGWRLVPAEVAEAGEAVLRLTCDEGYIIDCAPADALDAARDRRYKVSPFAEGQRAAFGPTLKDAVDAALEAGDE